jgi:hypothetical protein
MSDPRWIVDAFTGAVFGPGVAEAVQRALAERNPRMGNVGGGGGGGAGGPIIIKEGSLPEWWPKAPPGGGVKIPGEYMAEFFAPPN